MCVSLGFPQNSSICVKGGREYLNTEMTGNAEYTYLRPERGTQVAERKYSSKRRFLGQALRVEWDFSREQCD